MKKQQLKKLLKNFRPSMEQTKNRLFRELENKARNQYQMPIKVYTYKNRKNELFIEFLGQTAKDKILSVPLDKNFDIVIKRIQNEEAGLFDRFSSNLVEEIVTYWYQSPKSSSTQDTKVEATKENKEIVESKNQVQTKETPTDENENSASTGTSTHTEGAYQKFEEKITAFPKFIVRKTNEEIQVIEQAANERLLATIATNEVGKFTIEQALERKYKLKLEVIPIIEEFANTPIEDR